MSSMMRDPDSEGSNLGGKSSIGSLSPTRQWALSVGFYVNDPDSSVSSHDVFPQFTAQVIGVSNLPVCSFQRGI